MKTQSRPVPAAIVTASGAPAAGSVPALRRLLPMLLAALAVLLLMAGPAAAKRSKRANKPKPGASSSAPAFLGALDKQHENLVVVYDLMPHAEAFLQSAFAERLAGLMAEAGEEGVDLGELLRELKTNADNFPKQAALGVTRAGADSLGRLLRGALVAALTHSAKEIEDRAALGTLQAQLVTELTGYGFAGWTFFAQMRDEKVAKMAFGMVAGQAESALGSVPGVTATVTETAVGVSVDVGKLMPPKDISEALVELGLAFNADDPALPRLAGAVASMSFEVWLERLGDGFRLTFGPRPGKRAKGIKARSLGKLFRAEPADVLFTQWSGKGFRDAAASWKATWAAWAGTPTGDKLTALDEEGLVRKLVDVERQFDNHGDKGAMRLWVEPKVLKGLSEESGLPRMTALADLDVGKAIPGSAQIIITDAQVDLSMLFGELASALSDSLIDEIVASAAGDDEQDGALVTSARDHLTEFARLAGAGAGELFGPGMTMIGGYGGTVQKYEVVSVRGTERHKVAATGLPNYGVAMFGQLREGQDGPGHIRKMVEHAVVGMCAGFGFEVRGTDAFAKRDLGLGVETWVVGWDWLAACSEHKPRVTIQGDLQLHAFQVDNMMVLSTSKSLSQRILAAHAGKGRKVQPTPPAGALSGYGVITGTGVATAVDILKQWATTLAPEPEDKQEADKALTLIAKGLRLVDGIRWTYGLARPGRVGDLAITIK